MSSMVWKDIRPSNLALVKYMGKRAGANQATNGSLSVTLDRLVTHAEVRVGERDHWEALESNPESGEQFEPIELNETGRSKLWRHVDLIRGEFGVRAKFLVRSANNFPSDCGIASSASSFAALTGAVARACAELSGRPVPPIKELSALARKGSGSSCRSFFSPFSLWRGEGGESIPSIERLHLDHNVVIVSEQSKAVSSSEAHQRVAGSELFSGRIERAEARLGRLERGLAQLVESPEDRSLWRSLCDLVWIEFWDMHALFETSQPPFGYFTGETVEALNQIRSLWREVGDGPMTTMDAGANVHVLWRPDQVWLRAGLVARFERLGYRVLVGR